MGSKFKITAITICIWLAYGSLFLVNAGLVNAQTVQDRIDNVVYTGTAVEFEVWTNKTLEEVQSFVFNAYQNDVKKSITIACNGPLHDENQVQYYTCNGFLPTLNIGNNIFEITYTDQSIESARSNSLIIYHAVTQVVKETQYQTLVKCQPGTYNVGRYTFLNQFTTALNAVQNTVVAFFATSNAVYFVSCIPQSEGQ